MVIAYAQCETRSALCPRSEAESVEQMSRRVMAELGVVLDVQMVVFIALPGVHGRGESRDQAGPRHATRSLQSVDDCFKWPKKPQKSTLFVHWGLAGDRFVDNLGAVNGALGRQERWRTKNVRDPSTARRQRGTIVRRVGHFINTRGLDSKGSATTARSRVTTLGSISTTRSVLARTCRCPLPICTMVWWRSKTAR